MTLPAELLARAARIAAELPAADGSIGPSLIPPAPIEPSAAASSTRSRRRHTKRRTRRRADVERRRELQEKWRRMSAIRIDDVPLPPRLPMELRGVVVGVQQDTSAEHRRAAEVCRWRLPAEMARRLFSVRHTYRDWPRLVSVALEQWRTSKRARPGARCTRIVDGICRTAHNKVLLDVRGRESAMDTIWGMDGPIRELERLGILTRRQPLVGTTPYVGPKRCRRCRGVLGVSCACAVPVVMQWSVGQTCFQRDMCGASLHTLARIGGDDGREARAFLKLHTPWLYEREDELRAEASESFQELPDLPPLLAPDEPGARAQRGADERPPPHPPPE